MLARAEEFAHASVIVVVVSMFTNIADVRFVCMLQACQHISRLRIPVICVDDSPAHLHGEVKQKLEQASNGFIRVSKFQGEGRKGASLREAISLAMASRRQDSGERWAIAFTELEKADFFPNLAKCAEPILRNEADIVTPFRNLALFQSTYALEQFYSESLGNRLTNLRWKEEIGDATFNDLDWYFGPILWCANTVSKYYLEGVDLEMWDAQIVPSIRAYKSRAAPRWLSVEIPYKHPGKMKLEEENNISFCEKRMMQLGMLTSELTKAIVAKVPLSPRPCLRRVLLCGSSGNVGTRLVQHFATRLNEVQLICMDLRLPSLDSRVANVEYVECDFLQSGAQMLQGWGKHFAGAYTVFVLAARNPFPDANSEEAFDSMRITSNVLEACALHGVGKIVYASSNHVLGGHLFDTGKLAAKQVPNFGTKYELERVNFKIDSTLYTSAKVAGEAQIEAMVKSNRLKRAIIVRIGYILPGENKREAITATGTPKSSMDASGGKRLKKEQEEKEDLILRWYQGMHFRTEDLNLLADCCCGIGQARSANGWGDNNNGEDRIIYVNGVSNNPGTRWEIGSDKLGFHPQ